MAGRVEYTIDELAREAGTTVRSLRVYHDRGVLPPPQVKGRTGFYGPEHLNRVRTISRLLDRGIKLNGIRELLEAWDRGDDLGDVLGVSEESVEPAVDAAAEETIPATELAQRYRAVSNGLTRVVAAGLYEPVDATTYRPADRRLIDVIDEMEAAGIPADEVLTEVERARTDADRIARRFVELFHRTAWQTYQRSARSAADRATLTESLGVTRAVPGRVMGELVDRFVARYLDEDAELGELSTDS
ncbi:MerR family transcriptional regulator [Nocardia cyriacigeorgica]|uniref:MerR family transcriptional regulator n=1 Tax=Nocardia cyriacigeorgica TaxID=135487 RepID=UPI002453BB5A|nr:MerR family transcriptional regulator [Nocardia cyriacigeorgica]